MFEKVSLNVIITKLQIKVDILQSKNQSSLTSCRNLQKDDTFLKQVFTLWFIHKDVMK